MNVWGNLDLAEGLIRDVLHVHGIDAVVRAHLQRSLAHVREAVVGHNQPSPARSVEQLVREQESFERLMTAAIQHSKNHAETLSVKIGV